MIRTFKDHPARHLARALIAASALLVAGCGTIEGVGKDISGAARTVQGWF